MFYADNHLFDTVSQAPGCTRNCNNCGDWIFNCRQTCPNSSKKINKRIGTTVLNSRHGTRLRAFPDGRLDLTVNNDYCQQWQEIFTGLNKGFLMSYHGTFLGAHQNGSAYLAEKARDWQTWTKQLHGSQYAWKSCHGTYLKGEPGGKVSLANSRKTWELWHH